MLGAEVVVLGAEVVDVLVLLALVAVDVDIRGDVVSI